MTNNNLKITLKSITEKSKNANIIEIHSSPVYDVVCIGVNNFEVHYDVNIAIGEENRDFKIIMKSKGDTRLNHDGYSMIAGVDFNMEEDETIEAIVFLSTHGYCENNLNILFDYATERCQQYLHNHAPEVLNCSFAKNKILKQIKLYEKEQLPFATDEYLYQTIHKEINDYFKKYLRSGDLQFEVEQNPNGFQNILDSVKELKQEMYLSFLGVEQDELDEMVNQPLTDLKPLLKNEDKHSLVFAVLMERAKSEYTNNEDVYIDFTRNLTELVHGKPKTVNTWHIEQNKIKPLDEQQSIEALCYNQFCNVINNELNLQNKGAKIQP